MKVNYAARGDVPAAAVAVRRVRSVNRDPSKEPPGGHPVSPRRRRRRPAVAHVQGRTPRRPRRAGSRLPRPGVRADRSLAGGAAQPRLALRARPSRWYRLHLDPAGRPGHRALGRSVLRAEPAVLRPGQHLPPGDRGRLQRGGDDVRRAGGRQQAVRPQDPVHREAQPQRADDLPEQVRPDHVRFRQAGLRPRRRRGRGHDLLRLAGGHSPDPGGVGRLPRGARARPVHRPVVLPAQQRLQDRRRRLPRRRPTSPRRRTTSASRSRPTSSSRSCPRTTAATTPCRATARPASWSTSS